MGELWFIGVGLGDEQDLSLRALERLRSCGELFAEEYTATLSPGSMERLADRVGHPVTLLDRAEVEAGTRVLDALARHPRVALVVAGDPFMATTHVALRVQAEEAGHDWQYLPNASILTAAPGLLGLQPYRFGRPVSLPFPEPGFAPSSPLERIRANLAQHLHTLLLLDLRPAEGRFLTAPEAIQILVERGPSEPWLAPQAPLAAVGRVGSPEARAVYGPRHRVAAVDLGPPLHAVVIPSEPLHFEEEEAVRRWRVG